MLVEKRPRATRRDAGEVRMTYRDAEVLEFLAHQYGAPLDLVRQALTEPPEEGEEPTPPGMPRVYQVVQRWKRAGWIETAGVDRGPTWIYPKKSVAQRFLGWQVNEWVPRSTLAPHTRAVAATRLHLMGRDLQNWTSERTLRHELDQAKRGRERGHVPDGIHWTVQGGYAIEVELTGKGRQRTEDSFKALAAFAAQRNLTGVVYFCTSNAMPVVGELVARRNEEEQRAAANLQQQGKAANVLQWHVRPIEEVPRWTA